MESFVYGLSLLVGAALIISSFVEFFRTRRTSAFGVYRFFFGLAYFITPGAEFFQPGLRGIETVATDSYARTEPLTTFILSIIGFGTSILGYHLARMRGQEVSGRDPRRDKAIMRRFASVCMLLCVVAAFIYSTQYGGIVNAIKYAGVIRAGGGEFLVQDGGKLLFFKYLIPLGIFAFLALVSLRVEFREKNVGFFTFTVFALITLFGLFLMAGRGRIVAFGLSIAVLYFAIAGKRIPITTSKLAALTIAALCAFVFVLYGKIFFASMAKDDPLEAFRSRVETTETPGASILHNYENHSVSVEVALGYLASGGKPRYLQDVLNLPATILPSRLLGIEKPEPISVLNTYLLAGIRDSETPPGLVAFGLYAAGPLGVVVTLTLFGALLAFIDNRLSSTGLARLFAAWASVAVVVGGGSGDPRVLMYTVLPLGVAAGIASMLRRTMRAPRRQPYRSVAA